MSAASIAGELDRVRGEIAAAALRAGRSPDEVTLVAVTKQFPVGVLEEAVAAGQRDFGENRVQEAVSKYKKLGTQVRWHFVGRLQRNKVRSLVGWIDLIHSVDRGDLAEEIDRRAPRPVEVLIEVNISGEPAKGGAAPEDVPGLLDLLSPMPSLRVTGLMGMAPVVARPEEARPYFRRLARLAEEARQRFPDLNIHHLSMGMSQDYTVAVEEGATLVRVGQGLFGRRPSPAPREDRMQETSGRQTR